MEGDHETWKENINQIQVAEGTQSKGRQVEMTSQPPCAASSHLLFYLISVTSLETAERPPIAGDEATETWRGTLQRPPPPPAGADEKKRGLSPDSFKISFFPHPPTVPWQDSRWGEGVDQGGQPRGGNF